MVAYLSHTQRVGGSNPPSAFTLFMFYTIILQSGKINLIATYILLLSLRRSYTTKSIKIIRKITKGGIKDEEENERYKDIVR